MIRQFRTLRVSSPLIGREFAMAALLAAVIAVGQPVRAADGGQRMFERIPTQFIAALGDPDATAGSGAQDWGVWPVDPGPRGVRLNRYERLQAAEGLAPAGWRFDAADWWLEENGLIMESPEFPLMPGQYLVTGGREVTTVLTVHPADAQGVARCELAEIVLTIDRPLIGGRAGSLAQAAQLLDAVFGAHNSPGSLRFDHRGG